MVNTTNNNNYKLGEIVRVEGIFNRPSNNTTKYLFNYKKYLERNKIYYIVSANKIVLIKKNKNIYYFIKQIIINSLNKNPYLYTFILGDKSLIKKDSLRSYQENGISHLFAISGMHISLLSSIISKCLRKIKSEEKRYKIISIVLILYLLLIGLSPSVLRGVLFYTLFNANSIYYFYIKKENLFLIILSLSLIINPNYIFDVGFEYSYLISYSLIKTSDILKSNNKIISLLKVSLLSFFVSIPITLYNYNQLNLLSIIYNLFYVPFISIIIFPLSLIIVLIKPIEPLYIFLTNLLEKTSILLSQISIGKIIFKRLPLIIYIVYFLLIILFINTRNKKIIYVFLTIIILHLIIPNISNTNYVEFLDVGQGDSIIIHLNRNNIVIDTGGNKESNEFFYNTLYPSLKKNGINKIDYLIISHGDYDHMGEALKLINNYKVDKVIFNCGEYNFLEKELIKKLNEKNIKYYSCINKIDVGKNTLYFLQTHEYSDENNNSNVIYTEIESIKFLFTGDAGIEKEKDLINEYNIQEIDVLKAGHHGSKTSSSKMFINEINPKYSVISVGKNNRYGHPNKEVLECLKYSKIYRTDQKGSIMFKIKNNKVKVETLSP